MLTKCYTLKSKFGNDWGGKEQGMVTGRVYMSQDTTVMDMDQIQEQVLLN